MAVAATLKKIGFEVEVVTDADYKTMELAIKRHVAKVRDAGDEAIGFFYYSGHGAANPQTHINYLIPVDLADAETDDMWNQSIELRDIVDRFASQAPDAAHFVIFDACRDELKLKPSTRGLGGSKGFEPIATPSGVLTAYATAANKTASDAGPASGPYAQALSEEIVKPGVESVAMFRTVQLKVKRAIGQDPWLSVPALRLVYFAGEEPVKAPDAEKADRQALTDK